MVNKGNEVLPVVGDVITSPKFAFGYTDSGGKIAIDGKSTSHQVQIPVSTKERLEIAAKTGVIVPDYRIEDYGAYDESRGTAQFVVIDASMQGGGIAMNADRYPHGYHITAQRLKDGKFDPEGEVIHFYLSGAFTIQLLPSDITIVGKLPKLW